MRLAAVLLSASLAVTAGGALVHAASPQKSDDESIQSFLLRLERIVQEADPVAYNTLVVASADRVRGARFIDTELIRGMTRAVIQERGRAPLAPPGDGYSVAVDVFQEYGNRSRVSTWWLDLMRNKDAAADSRWLIADQGRFSSVEDLYRLSLNPATQFTAHNLEFRDGDLHLTLPAGSVFVADTESGVTALVLMGRGGMSFHPTPDTEKTQVKIFSGSDGIDVPFDAAYIRINPDDFDRLIAKDQLIGRPVDQGDFRAADRIFREDYRKSFGLDLGDLSRDTWSFMPRSGDLVAEIHTRRFNTLMYSHSSGSREDITLFNRDNHKTIAMYSSPSNERVDAPLGPEDSTDFDVQHYDIDVAATPDRRWIEGRARLTLRVGSKAVSNLTFRLAEPLVVQSVVSEEYGRLFSMRIKDQDSLVVSLPMTLLRDAELTLTVTYAGRLEPQALDAEAIAAGQLNRASTLDTPRIFSPEPSFVYSSQSQWYPRSSENDYATATIRVTVPASLACVASGEQDSHSPALVNGPGSSHLKVYEFNAAQPLRYLAFVVGKFTPMQSLPADRLNVSVSANPGHVKRAREVAERTVEIAQFYQSLLDDSPYPSFTVALVEGERPGGHSPGYFAVLNDPPPGSAAFVQRNDPAFFDNYPDFFLAHEIAHQWWGQAVGWRNYHEQWLSEGFAQYFAAMFAQKGPDGDDVFRGMLRLMRRWAIDETDQGPISLGYRLGHIQSDSRIMRALVYDKGALVLHMLRRLVGDDVFLRGVRRFYQTARFRSAGTVDFRTAIESEAGHPLGRFFDRWIYGDTLPRITFSYRVEGSDVVLHVEQRGDLFDFPLTVTLEYADGGSADVDVPVTDRSVDFRTPLAGTLKTAEISKNDFSLASVAKN